MTGKAQSVQEQTTGHDPVWIWTNHVTGTQIPSHNWWPLAPFACGQSNIASVLPEPGICRAN